MKGSVGWLPSCRSWLGLFSSGLISAGLSVWAQRRALDAAKTAQREAEMLAARLAAERARAEAEAARLQAVLDAMAETVTMVDPDGVVVLANPAWLRLLGLSSGESVVGKRLADLVARGIDVRRPDGTLVPVEGLSSMRARRGETVRDWELVQRGLDGREHHLSFSSVPVRDEEGRLLGGVTVGRDVTDLQRAVAEAEARARREELANRIGWAIRQRLDLDSILRAATRELGQALEAASCRIWLIEERPHGPPEAWVAHEFLARNLPSFMHHRQPLHGDPFVARLAEVETPLVIADISKEDLPASLVSALQEAGQWALVGAMACYEGRPVAYLWVGQDAPRAWSADELRLIQMVADQVAVAVEQARLYQQAEADRQLLRAMLKSMGDAVTATDRQGRVVFRNMAAQELTGRPLDAPLLNADPAEPCYLAGPPCERLPLDETPLRRASRGELVLGEEFTLCRADGTCRAVISTTTPIRSERGEFLGVVSLFRDITRLKELEQAREDLVSVVAHELKTPLTTIKGYAQTLLRRLPNEADRPLEFKALRAIDGQATKMDRLITELLEMGRIRSGRLQLHLETVDLGDLLVRLAERFQVTTERHQIALHVHEDAVVEADPFRLDQVLSNLLGNAIKYSPKGGAITVSLAREGDEAVVAVRDEGIGIAPDQQGRVFEPFYRAHGGRPEFSGMGIGLYIAAEMVARHGGRLWLESVEGAGTTFYVALPVPTGS